MTPEETRHLARRCIELLGSRQLPAMFELLHDDATFTIPFDRATFPFGGTFTKEGMRAVVSQFQSGFDDFEIAVTSVVAESGRAAVEAVGHGRGPGDARYENVFHFALECDGGKVRRFREYFNPIAVSAYAAQLPPSSLEALAGAASPVEA